jgi:N-acetylmuramoyl-L-alanine amidase
MMKLFLITIAFFSTVTLKGQTLTVVDKPAVFDEERQRLSVEYLQKRHGINTTRPYITPRMVVLHWTGSATLEGGFNTMNPSTLRGSRKDLASSSDLNVCAQFLVDRDGTIYRLLPDTAFARHTIGLNYCAVGVENVGSNKMPLTDAQLNANEAIVRYLKAKYDIQYVIGHYEYSLFDHHPLWKEADSSYRTVKTDPGIDFMKKIRDRVKDLGLQGPPSK